MNTYIHEVPISQSPQEVPAAEEMNFGSLCSIEKCRL